MYLENAFTHKQYCMCAFSSGTYLFHGDQCSTFLVTHIITGIRSMYKVIEQRSQVKCLDMFNTNILLCTLHTINRTLDYIVTSVLYSKGGVIYDAVWSL